jgi:hypothetical protein
MNIKKHMKAEKSLKTQEFVKPYDQGTGIPAPFPGKFTALGS